MKRHRLVVLLIALLISFMLVGIGSSANSRPGSSPNSQPPASPSSIAPEQADQSQAFEEPDPESDGEDPDLPAGAKGRIDEATYLRAREQHIARLRGWEVGRFIDPMGRLKAIEQMQQQEQARDARERFLASMKTLVGLTPQAGPVWTELGPNPIPNGQTSPSVAVSGRVSAIEIDPTDPNKVYVGAAQGGVFRSLNGGTTWTPIFDSADTLAIGALTLDVANGRLWVGTGEANGSADCFAGVGLYRIDNVNTTADLVGPINPVRNYTDNGGTPRSAPAFNGRSISKILIVPGDPNSLLVGSAGGVIGIGGNVPFGNTVPPLGLRGLYKLTNAGGAPASVAVTRIAVSPNAVAGGCFDTPCTGNRNVNDMVFDPTDPSGNTLVVWLNGINVANDGGIYRSTNALGGSPTFTQTLVTTSASTSNGRGVLAAYKEGANPTVVYVASGEPNVGTLCTSTSFGALRRSIDGGVTWSTELPGGGGFCAGQCFYNIGFDVLPGPTTATSDDKLLLGGNVGSGICARQQSTSLDGAATTFTNHSGNTHADTHVIKFAPSNSSIVYRGDDGGIWKSTDGGDNWTTLNNATFRATQFQSIALHPIDRDFTVGGTQDNGTERLTSLIGWVRADGGDGGYALIDQNATNLNNVFVYHTYFNSSGSQIGYNRSVDGAATWPIFYGCGGQANGINCADAVNFYAPMALGPGNPNTLYFGSDRLYRSTSTGLIMNLVSQGPLVNGIPISAIGISPQADGYRIVGGDGGALFYTTTGSSTLTLLDPTGAGSAVPDFYVARVVFDPNNKNTAYLALGNYAGGTAPTQSHVWRVTNLSTTPVFTARNGTGGNILPDVPVNGFAIDPANSNNLYAGTDIGVYNSTDGGLTWSPYGSGLPRVAVFDMAIQAPNRVLRIATHGRGMWETSLVSPGASTVQFIAATFPTVTEGAVSASVRVTRSGDISFPASVSYSTSDTAGATACDSSGGVGSSRCDYIITSGTLNFAANESFKDILIPIVDDAYVEGSENFSINLSAPTGLGLTLGAPATASLTIADNGDVGSPNLIDQTNPFVREQYIDFLNREPDAAGFNFWTDQINSCGSDAACVDIRRINVSAAFFVSIEFQKTGYLVERLYKASYGDASGSSSNGGTHNLRVPVIRFNELLPDTQRIGRGVVVNFGNWQQQLEDNTQAFTEEFVQRPRFLTEFPTSMTPAQFVDQLNSRARDVSDVMPLSQAERDQLVSDLTAGVKTRAQVLRAVAEDSELNNSEKNRAFVLMQYFGYLRRNPNDAPEMGLDYSGYEFWLGKLNQFGGNFVNAEMVKSFLVSAEYRHRFGP